MAGNFYRPLLSLSLAWDHARSGLEPAGYEAGAAQVAGMLKQDAVDAVFLTPV